MEEPDDEALKLESFARRRSLTRVTVAFSTMAWKSVGSEACSAVRPVPDSTTDSAMVAVSSVVGLRVGTDDGAGDGADDGLGEKT